jgi:hypothetical protein
MTGSVKIFERHRECLCGVLAEDGKLVRPMDGRSQPGVRPPRDARRTARPSASEKCCQSAITPSASPLSISCTILSMRTTVSPAACRRRSCQAVRFWTRAQQPPEVPAAFDRCLNVAKRYPRGTEMRRAVFCGDKLRPYPQFAASLTSARRSARMRRMPRPPIPTRGSTARRTDPGVGYAS